MPAAVRWTLAATLVALSILCAVAARATEAAAAPPPPEAEELSPAERLGALVERVRWENARIDTLQAEFTMRKESSLLLEPETSSGLFSYRAPDRVRWEYLEPNPISLLIDGDEMTTWYRDLDRVERVAIGEQSQRVLKYMGASSSIGSLLEYFDVRLHMPEDPDIPYRLELEPRYDRVAKRLRAMSVWIDRHLFLPVRLHYVEPDGDVTEFTFSDFRLNRELPADLFELDLPQDVEVSVTAPNGRAP